MKTQKINTKQYKRQLFCERKSKKENLLGVHFSDELHIKKYGGWGHTKQTEKYFAKISKTIKEPFQHLFYDNSIFGSWLKIYILSNKQAKENVNICGNKKHYRYKKTYQFV